MEQKLMLQKLQPDMFILLDDGKLQLQVVQRYTPTMVCCKVVIGGVLKSNKGVNVPQLALDTPALTNKDYDDLEFFLEAGVDWVAVSFVQRAQDLLDVAEFIDVSLMTNESWPPAPKIIPKIEKPQALVNIDAIMQLLPRAKLEVFKGAGHAFLVKEVVHGANEQVVRFLA